ncbi:MAG: hypothetical protein RBS38_11730 [Bacteroidales bacterium]|jgi:hypothetical protein|nr:hypothetical protein [Bacteroidales bacterium]
MKTSFIPAVLLLLFFIPVSGQDTINTGDIDIFTSPVVFGGFVRGGLYTWTDKDDDKLHVPAAFSDIGLKLETGRGKGFKAFADVRFRYGAEFSEPVSSLDIREAWVQVNGAKWNISAGQKIIKWGRCDFTNPTNRLSPVNTVMRSPDREDMDMANLLVAARVSPWSPVSLEAVFIPYYRPSVLIIDPIPLPAFVGIEQLPTLVTDSKMYGYALRADFHPRLIDFSVSWFDGYDPMPGIALTTFNLELERSIPLMEVGLSVKSYRNRVLGADFETIAGPFGIRGEAAWSDPDLSFRVNEYVPFPELEWAVGADWAAGIWRITAEYSGKHVSDFVPSAVDPLLGYEIDFSGFAPLLANPEFDAGDYVKQQVGAFNRLYNYQMYELYHSAGLRAEAELMYGKILPSLTTLYNFTSHDLLVMPELRVKSSDGLTVVAGAEIYSGRKGSLYDIVEDFMNGVYVSLRVDF